MEQLERNGSILARLQKVVQSLQEISKFVLSAGDGAIAQKHVVHQVFAHVLRSVDGTERELAVENINKLTPMLVDLLTHFIAMYGVKIQRW